MSIPLLFGDNRKKGGLGYGVPITEMTGESAGEAKLAVMQAFIAAVKASDAEAAVAAGSKFVSLCVPVPVKDDYGDDPVNSPRGY